MARTAKRKGLSDWSKEVRDRDKSCIVCNRDDRLNSHHILAKENYHELMFETQNGVALCPFHHRFGKYSAHKNPIWFSKFLQDHRPNQYKWAIENMGDIDC